jgi:hypothetical protein
MGLRSQGHFSLLLPGPRGPWGLQSVESENGRLTYFAETKRASCPSSVHSSHIVDRVLAAGEVKGRIFFFPMSCLVALEAGPWRCALLSSHLKVEGCDLKAAIRSCVFYWSQASSRLLNTLNAIFTRSHWGVWGPPSACLSFFFFFFFRISWKDWEIKWELRIIGLGI